MAALESGRPVGFVSTFRFGRYDLRAPSLDSVRPRRSDFAQQSGALVSMLRVFRPGYRLVRIVRGRRTTARSEFCAGVFSQICRRRVVLDALRGPE